MPLRSASRTAALQKLSGACRHYQGHATAIETLQDSFSTTVFVAPQIVARLTEPSVITGRVATQKHFKNCSATNALRRVSPLPRSPQLRHATVIETLHDPISTNVFVAPQIVARFYRTISYNGACCHAEALQEQQRYKRSRSRVAATSDTPRLSKHTKARLPRAVFSSTAITISSAAIRCCPSLRHQSVEVTGVEN